MQTRKIVVTIKTIDDKHCHQGCDFFNLIQPFCELNCINQKLDKIGYLRTKECLKREVKE
jgi:hypothetical protein